MNKNKEFIIQNIFTNNVEKLSTLIPSYLDKYPYDVDMYVIAGFYYLQQQELESAEKFLQLSIEHNYYDVDTSFLLGELYFEKKNFFTAMEFYSKAAILHSYYQKEYLFFSPDLYSQKFDDLQQDLAEYIDLHPEKTSELKKKLDQHFQDADQSFYLLSDTYHLKNTPGTVVRYPHNERRLCAFFEPADLFSSKYRSEQLFPLFTGNDFSFSTEVPVLLPIASVKPEANINFSVSSDENIVKSLLYPNHFNYYRISDNCHITSKDDFFIGQPITLMQKKSIKKLVLSFFIDGLSWQLIQEECLETVMPNTFEFFSKGMIFENFFTTSDWTYPSLPSFICGYSVPKHMMIHPHINRTLPQYTESLFAYLKNAGYYTAMLNCDPRSSSTHGYTKDIDRYVTQHPVCYKVKQVIPDALEHLQAFRETNQYLWITIPDLHDIADEIDLPLNTLAQIDIKNQKIQEKCATSVKQKFSCEKRNAYIQALQAIDIQFSSLYRYIENNYKENEFVVTLFGDHGQTYLVKPETHKLTRYHSNAGFLIRGSVPQGICNEYISAVDYAHILCNLAGTKPFQSPDGQLPKFFGGNNEREYTITETIHPGDPYRAAIHAPTHAFYYTSKNLLTPDGRLEQGNYQIQLVDNSGASIKNPELTKKYIYLINERLKYIYIY